MEVRDWNELGWLKSNSAVSIQYSRIPHANSIYPQTLVSSSIPSGVKRLVAAEWRRPSMGAVMPGCMSVARRSTIYAAPCAVPSCMVETVTRNAGVVSYPIHPYVTCNAGLVSTSENV